LPVSGTGKVPYLATKGIGMRGDVALLYESCLAATRKRPSLSTLGVSFFDISLVGYGIHAWGLPSVLSALGILFSIAFVVLLLPLVVRERSLSPAEGVKQ
jgi:hypothetical protein